MRINTTAILACAAASVLAARAASAGPIVTNPNFAGPNGYGQVPGWTEVLTTTGQYPDLAGSGLRSNSAFVNNGVLPNGITTAGFIQSNDPAAPSSFRQTLTLIAGENYTLSYYENERSGQGDGSSFATIGGDTVVGTHRVKPAGAASFYYVSANFTALSTSEQLALYATAYGNGNSSWLVTDVIVTDLGTNVNGTGGNTVDSPEPGTLAVFSPAMLGVLSLAFQGRRRFRKAA